MMIEDMCSESYTLRSPAYILRLRPCRRPLQLTDDWQEWWTWQDLVVQGLHLAVQGLHLAALWLHLVALGLHLASQGLSNCPQGLVNGLQGLHMATTQHICTICWIWLGWLASQDSRREVRGDNLLDPGPYTNRQ